MGRLNFEWTYQAPEGVPFQSNILSSTQRMENNNTLINIGRSGIFYELNEADEIIWSYKVPINQGAFATQGDSLVVSSNLTFNVKRYPLDFDGFEGRDLSPKGFLELSPNEDFCDPIMGIETLVENPVDMWISPNPFRENLTIEVENPVAAPLTVHIYNALGQLVYEETMRNELHKIATRNWQEGIYFVRIGNVHQKVILQK